MYIYIIIIVIRFRRHRDDTGFDKFSDI